MAEDLDKDTLELLERRMADRVAERVRGSLFKVYALVGSAAIAALGYAGVDFISTTRQSALDAAKRQTTETIKETADQARAAIDRVRISAVVAEQMQEQARRTITRLDDQIATLAPKIQLLEQMATQIDALEAKRKTFEIQIANNTDAARAGAESATRVAELARQVEELSKLVRVASAGAQPPASAAITAATQQIYDAASAAATEQRRILDRPPTTVFLQFAGMPRDAANELAQALRKHGYAVPGVDEEPARALNLREIRYYWPADESAARSLAVQARQALAQLNLGDDREIAVRNFTGWSRAKPTQGIIELWLGLAPRR
ncbi:MAG: hypothetical protein JNK67_20585 [Alphaproteobacteria bacterium]|nr:hypothetical protein [Alphaproteobacteria bacterium]